MVFGVYNSKTGKVCSLKDIQYNILVQDFTLKKRIVQRFVNKFKTPVEMIYKFGTEETVTVYFVEVELYDPNKDERKVLKAKIYEKEKAKEKYEDAISEGNSAVLAEANDDNEITLSLGLILKGVEVTVTMETIEEMKIEKNAFKASITNYKISIPSLNYSGKEKVSAKKNVSVDLKVNLSNGSILKDMKSTSHEKSFEKNMDKTKGLLKSITKVSYAKDIDIVVAIEKAPIVSAIVEEGKDDKFTTMISFVPGFTEYDSSMINTELIIIVDCSGSMSGSRMRDAKKAMESFLQELNIEYNIKFNIVRFGSSYSSLYNKPKKLEKKSLEMGLNYIENTDSNMGGTNILKPIQFVLDTFVSPGYSRQVFLLTDGEDYNTEQIIKYVRKHAKTTRFFNFGIGSGINPILLTQTAKASNGRAVFLKSYGDDIQGKVVEQLKFAIQPALTAIQIQFPKGSNAKSCLNHIPPCYNMQKQSQYFFSSKIPKAIMISYAIGSEIHKEKVIPKMVKNNISILAAKMRVQELENYSEGKAEKEMLQLGLKYNFMTKQTSFLMVSENDEKIEEEMVLEKIKSVPDEDIEDNSYSYQRNTSNSNYNYNNNTSSYSAPSSTRRRGFDISIPNPFSIGGCIGSSSMCKVRESKSGKIHSIQIKHLKEEDMVLTVNKKGKREYTKVIEMANHESIRDVIVITLKNEKKLTLSRCHLLYVNDVKSELSSFKLLPAKKLQIGMFVKMEDGKCVEIIDLEDTKDHVTCVLTNNTRIICNGIIVSVFVSQEFLKGIYLYKKMYHKLPKIYKIKSIGNIFHYIFVKENIKIF